jgi:hypothetical protein
MFLGPDVVDLMGENAETLGKSAILTPTLRSLPDEFSTEFGHGSAPWTGMSERESGLGVENIDKLTDPQEFLQGEAFGGGDGSPIILLKKLADFLCRGAIKLEAENGPSGVRIHVPFPRCHDFFQNVRFRDFGCCCHVPIILVILDMSD